MDHVKWCNDLLDNNMRRQGLCFQRESGKISNIRENFFKNSVIPLWNGLPVNVKEARTLNSFKADLDKLKLFMV